MLLTDTYFLEQNDKNFGSRGIKRSILKNTKAFGVSCLISMEVY